MTSDQISPAAPPESHEAHPDLFDGLPPAVRGWLPQAGRLMSERAVLRSLGESRGLTIAQTRQLVRAGVFGPGYVGTFGRAFERSVVDDLGRQPERTPAEVFPTALEGYQHALVLRMHGLTPVRETHRHFIGTHVALIDATQPEIRRAANDAIRMHWRISEKRRGLVSRIVNSGGRVPLIVTVAKRVIGGREIVGIDHPAEAAAARDDGIVNRTAFAIESPGPWFDTVAGTWLNSGRGPAEIFWDRGTS